MKRRWLIFILIIVLFIILVASCFGGKKGLAPGKYEVSQATYEVSDKDYELQVKNYGEYDVAKLQVVTNPSQQNMMLEIKPDGSHTLFVRSENDIIMEQELPKFKKKKKKF